MNKFMQQNNLQNPASFNQSFVSTAGTITGAVPCHEINVNNISMSGDELLNSLALLQKGSAKASIEVYCTNCSGEINRGANNVLYASGLDLPFCTKKCSNDFFGV
jgi:hypothetical protein